MEWIISANNNIFKIIDLFNERDQVDWRQTVNYKVGDIIYMYCTKPYQKVMFKVEVIDIDLSFENIIDDRQFFVNENAYSIIKTNRYARLKLLKKIDTEELGLSNLLKNGLNWAPQGPAKVSEQLSVYLNKIIETDSKKLGGVNRSEATIPYEREVISIPASSTIDLIYKYKVHAHPNIEKSYPYKKSLYYTFRENGGWMKNLYELDTVVYLNPTHIDKINNLNLNNHEEERLKGYILERSKDFRFSNDGEYKFYILGDDINISKAVRLPGQNNHAYFTVKEILSGKEKLDRCNSATKINYDEVNRIIESNTNIDYVELDFDKIIDNQEFCEGSKLKRVVEIKKRNSRARKAKLADFRATNGKLYCEVCGVDDEMVLDVHHDSIKVEDMEEEHITRLEELRIVCANCHRRIHGLNLTVDELIINEEEKY